MTRYGMTVPFNGVPLHAQADLFRRLADVGYTDLWTGEANAHDAFTPLVLGSVWAPTLRLGTGIIPAYTRGPGCIAQSAASLAEAAVGRGRPHQCRHLPEPVHIVTIPDFIERGDQHRLVERRDRGALERDPVRGAVQEGA